MSAAEMPTEMEAICFNLHDVACAHSAEIASLPAQIAAIFGWTFSAEQTEAVRQLAWHLGHQARLLEFSLETLSVVLAGRAYDDRALFSKTTAVVDMCRFARAVPDVGPPPNPSTTALADAVEDAIADMQGDLRLRFPGEEHPGS